MTIEHMHSCIAADLADVEAALERQLRTLCVDDALLGDILDVFFAGGGKRLRPRLVLLSAFAMRQERVPPGPERDTVLSLAAIVELVHSASLMHDDVLDRASARRGVPSLNARFGDKVAILAGDILYSHAFEMLIDATDRATTHDLIRCVRGMCRGEITNLSGDGFAAYEQMIDDKTAALMRFCCGAAAAAVLEDPDEVGRVRALDAFGHSFGMVYQLADDLSDGDVNASLAAPGDIRKRLDHYVSLAREALGGVPRSAYRDGLDALLTFVLGQVKESVASPRQRQHDKRVAVLAG